MKIIFHLGLHKTATTWFQKVYFKEHPEIVMLNNALQPWSDRLITYLVQTPYGEFDPEYYNKLVTSKMNNQDSKTYIISAERLSGHPFSGAYDRHLIAKRIKASFPDSKILLFHRDQVAMIDSIYKQLVTEGYTDSVENMLSAQCWKKPCFDRSMYKYDLLHKNYLRVFDFEKIGFFSYDSFKINKTELIRELNKFLDINDYPGLQNIEHQVVNKSLNVRTIKIKKYFNYFVITEYNNFIFQLPKLIFRLFQAITNNIPCKEKSVLTTHQKKEITEYYRESNQLLQDMINKRK